MVRLFKILLVLFVFQPFVLNCMAEEEPMPCEISDKKTEIEAYLRQARHFMEKGDYVSAKRKLERVLELDKDNVEAKALMVECGKKIDVQNAAELEELNRAVGEGTEQALRDFIELHPTGFYIEQAENYLQDYNLWVEACQEGTKTAYVGYLAISNIKGYEKEAELAIKTINAEAAWDICKNNITVDDLEKFIKEYAGTPFEKEAEYELCLVKGEDLFNRGSYAMALKCYEDAHKIHSLTGQYLKHYRDVETEQRFETINSSNSIYELKDFLSRTSTDSPYYNPISNRLALILALKLTAYSSEQDFEEARKYAKDTGTRSRVDAIITNFKQQKREKTRVTRQMDRQKRWKGKVKCGWNVCDIFVGNDAMEFESGLRLRIGNNENVVNFLTGFDLQWFLYSIYTPGEYYDSYKSCSTSKLAIPASVRLNVGNNDFVTYFGLGTVIWPNAASTQQPAVAIEPQFGITGNKMEMSLCYRIVVSENEIIPSVRIHRLLGYNIIIYF